LEQANQATSLSEQTSLIELGLVSVELNPKPRFYVHTSQALKLLAAIPNRNWHSTTSDLKSFFEPVALS
jgi:hypothetical protein